MEEELVKRNTDCVYFLASPLTCKKGIDCEYRHSEIARLNPRECWYWLAGKCINPTCGFRHPPLDGHAVVSSQSVAYQCSAPTNKTNLPCYFYFNGFCNKGDRCFFLHGPDESVLTGESLKTDTLPLGCKTSIEDDANAVQSLPTETNPNPSRAAPNPTKDMDAQLNEDLQQPPKTIMHKSVPPKMSVSEFGKDDLVASNSFLQQEGITRSRSQIHIDENSEEPMDDHVGPEDRWESSSGFDVIVDNKSEDLDYENDLEHQLAPHRDQREHLLSKLETRRPNVEFLYDQDVYGAYEDSDNEHSFDYVRNPLGQPRDKRLNSTFSQKSGRLFPVELSIDERIGVDLRDYLRKRRVIDSGHLNLLPRKYGHAHLIGRVSERPRRHSTSLKLSGRLASKVGNHSIESVRDQGLNHKDTNRHGWLKHLAPNHSTRKLYKEKRLPRRKTDSLKVSRNLIGREMKSIDGSTSFTGPKTLAQIKEEKRNKEMIH